MGYFPDFSLLHAPFKNDHNQVKKYISISKPYVLIHSLMLLHMLSKE